ncbi:cyclin-D-binding Myb-like transcription factor 1 isoform X3 [Stegostoma tigrinum]|uniref:cyclin-D-binding Myb-like transcription factor 1 isoform X3 n=1 Tax=Stegostoma tigrinum TaxID=3053191 RepID=UPI00202B59AF|nr:cyclin-D-binding Myb-like transcription factor 1 isoform X3 [Stegostoma tigrinum]
MNTIEDESGTVTLETIRAVTIGQDTEGNLILHCPQNDLESEENQEPLHKRLCLSTEDDASLESTGIAGPFAAVQSVVTLPISDNDQSFEVTMTGEAASELTHASEIEGNETVTQIQVLHNEDHMDGISPQNNEDLDPVSQAWFTTKEDKDTLQNKGHKWKQGMWSKEEIDILMSNIENYLQIHGLSDATEVIFEMSKDERKDFYRTIARGLNRPLFAVYRRVLRMYDNRNHVGKYTPQEIEKLKELRLKHGNDWATIGAALGRSASSVKDRCRLMKDTCNTGKWTVDEEKRLAEVVHELTATDPGDIVTQGVSWAAVAERVGTRSEKQCRSKWLNYLNWKQSGGTEWSKDDEINLILRIAELNAEDESEINWDIMAEGWSSVRSPQWLRSKWWTIKRQVTNHKDLTFAASGDSCGSSTDCETITLNAGTLQRFEFLPSFRLQPTGTPGTYLIQTSSSQGLPITLTTSPTVTLTSPSSPEQIIVHTLSPEALLHSTNENVSVQMTQPSVIIHAVATDDITSSITQADLTVDSTIDHTDLTENQINSTSLETDAYSEIDHAKLTEDQSMVHTDLTETAIARSNLNSDSREEVMGSEVNIDESDLRQDVEVQSDLSGAYVTEALRSPNIESGIDEETTLIVSSNHGFIQSTDDIDNDSVLPLTTLTDPILQPQGDCSDIIGSTLETPDTDD